MKIKIYQIIYQQYLLIINLLIKIVNIKRVNHLLKLKIAVH